MVFNWSPGRVLSLQSRDPYPVNMTARDELHFRHDELQNSALTFAVPAYSAPDRAEYHRSITKGQSAWGDVPMGRKLFVLLAVTVLAASMPSDAKARGPATEQERARALDYIQSLETNPLAKDSLEKRMWLTEWIVQIPDFSVKPCCKALDSLDKINDTYSNQLRMQAIYSQAAYILQHPDAKNELEMRAAGLAGTLRAYRAIRHFDPSAKYPVLDNLLSLEKQGKLVHYVEQQTVCREN